MNTAQQIWQFFASRGLSPAQIAGIMGNLQVESSDNPNAFNANEGAIGLAQWEGNRRSALQSFAASQGTSETDLNTQLEFLWQELNTTESGALAALKQASTAGDAAAAFDQYYERSAGTSRTTRVADAQNYFTSFQGSGVNGLQPLGAGQTLLTGPGTGGSTPALTSDDYKSALGSLSSLLTSVPELKGILDQAISGGWAVTKFQQAIQQTQWWKTHNDSAKQLLALQSNDPAEYATRVGNAQSQVQNLAKQMGVTLNAAQLKALTSQFMVQGWDNQTLANKVGGQWNVHTNAANLSGTAAQYYQQLQQTYGDYGLPINDLSLRIRVQQMLEGNTNLDTYKQNVIQTAATLYPAIAQQIHSGLTVRQIADPYVQTMGSLLELDPNSLSIQDPTIKKALQGATVVQNGKSTTTPTSLTSFEQQLRNDPRWQTTQNAKDTVSNALVHIGRDFGFGGF